MLFDSFTDLFRVAVTAVTAYAALLIILRIAGKRALAKLNAFDLVVTVALGSTLATVLLSKDTALLEGVLALGMLIALQWAVARGSLVSSTVAQLVKSEPRLLVENGTYCWPAMEAERITAAEIRSAVRSAGVGSIEEVAAVVLESNGSLSVIADAGNKSALLDVIR